MEPSVVTSLGRIVGRGLIGVEEYLGIPYAVPPTGKRRFAPSRPWTTPFKTGLLDASGFGAPCHQSTGYWDTEPFEHPQSPPAIPPPSEDCLNLNIWRPARHTAHPRSLLPVMVWVHGGGMCGGSGSLKPFNGSQLTSRDANVLVVTLNYRLGPLGFLASHELLSTTGATGGLNGVHDQIVALKWIQAHVRSFGGDPERVTLWGESSGGVSVCLVNVSPLAKGAHCRDHHRPKPCLGPAPTALAPHRCSHRAV